MLDAFHFFLDLYEETMFSYGRTYESHGKEM